IFLATAQWFIALGTGLRKKALDAIDRDVKWIPKWGHDRIYNMVANRPDWCISRQRVWGVPIAALSCTKCGEAVTNTGIVERTATIFEVYGADAWYERPTEEFVPPGLTCAKCGSTSFEREKDILDVWFDSGSSHEAVMAVRPELTWPSDIYLEGSDQHRGWFQSSLLIALGTRGRPPFREVLTHGFLIDVDGQKMSKSRGNATEPQEVIKESGAEILRLWTAMSDYTEEIRVSKEILARVVEAYRKLRNTVRYLVANLYDFDPATDRVPLDQLEEVDRFILARYAQLGQKLVDGYGEYDYSTMCQALNAFLTIDLSALYNDISKDRMYTFAPKSRQRRSGQTAMYVMADGLARLLAPILPVTADQLWAALPGTRDASVHLALFPAAGELQALVDTDLLNRWTRLIAVREQVLADIEPLRKNKQIGSSLQAKVVLHASKEDFVLLHQHAKDLPMLFIVSEVDLHTVPEGSQAPELRVTIERAGGVKCERCWRYVDKVSDAPAWAGLCERCQDALAPGNQAA
ncbi:MAG TPA: class I tRNA ligase family protein, partial [Vicinamibacterales bacterium]|nr:class I tRNA ligase family protein [Vicinamibacterales bacterium]